MAANLAVKDGAGVANSLRTKEPSTDIHQPYHGVLDGEDITIGAKADAAVTNPASTASLVAVTKGNLTQLSAILAKIIAAPATEAKQDAAATLTGAVTETAPGTDTASSGLNGRLQRVAQRLTDLITAVGGYLTTRGYGFDVAVTPTVTSGSYSAGDIMGALMTFTISRANDEPVVIMGAQVACKADVAPTLTLVLFNADPTSTPKTDNAAWSLNAADAFKVIATIPFGSTWVDHGTPNTICADNLHIVASPVSGGRAVYGILVDATGVTLTSTSVIQVRLRGVGC